MRCMNLSKKGLAIRQYHLHVRVIFIHTPNIPLPMVDNLVD
ncbi:hypothetical protein SAMN05878482_104423 [Peribacillus simplex]|uniref:Uncharacterized protein n=1 Tax=Peribacillus simplex TaxID=1478 RepID=A0A9X8RAK5_9BACI|nr:hypothetical protein SAMN05878482_104423 [Peribacillus simplex]